jgi:hypothetical protein
MNERMLLDNWKYYQEKGECNWLLKRTLMEDETRTPAEKMEFYLANRRVVNDNADEIKDQEEYLDKLYINKEKKISEQLSRPPKRALRENNVVTIFKEDLEYIKFVRQEHVLTVPQIEIVFGIIFFTRMYDVSDANISTEFRKKQFLSCFDRATREDLTFVMDTVIGLERTDYDDVVYEDWHIYDYSNAIEIKVTKANNKLNLTKLAHKYIPDILDKRYCELCLRPYEPTNNRQKVCTHCKTIADSLKARYRKIKQRYKEAHGEDACCGKCTDCIQTDCSNWWSYWYNQYNLECYLQRKYKYEQDVGRWFASYAIPDEYTLSDEEKEEIKELMKKYIKNGMYTEEMKSKLVPYEISVIFKKY